MPLSLDLRALLDIGGQTVEEKARVPPEEPELRPLAGGDQSGRKRLCEQKAVVGSKHADVVQAAVKARKHAGRCTWPVVVDPNSNQLAGRL